MKKWTQEAEQALQELPLPPMLQRYARFECERIARNQGLDTIGIETVRTADKNYDRAIGRDVMRKLRAMVRGELEEPLVPDELFDDADENELYSINMCPSKYGAASNMKIENMKRLLPPLRRALRRFGVTDIMMDLTKDAVMPHNEFRITITGCTNACLSPYFSDFGILGSYEVAVIADTCTGCGLCAEYCSLGAITMQDGVPQFDKRVCIRCAGCEEFCPESAISVERMGYKVVAGGHGARHPVIAETIAEHTDLDGVISILERSIQLIKENVREPMRVFSLYRVMQKHGSEHLTW